MRPKPEPNPYSEFLEQFHNVAGSFPEPHPPLGVLMTEQALQSLTIIFTTIPAEGAELRSGYSDESYFRGFLAGVAVFTPPWHTGPATFFVIPKP